MASDHFSTMPSASQTGDCGNCSRPKEYNELAMTSRSCLPTKSSSINRGKYARIALKLKQLDEERAIHERAFEAAKRAIALERMAIEAKYKLLEERISKAPKKHNMCKKTDSTRLSSDNKQLHTAAEGLQETQKVCQENQTQLDLVEQPNTDAILDFVPNDQYLFTGSDMKTTNDMKTTEADDHVIIPFLPTNYPIASRDNMITRGEPTIRCIVQWLKYCMQSTTRWVIVDMNLELVVCERTDFRVTVTWLKSFCVQLDPDTGQSRGVQRNKGEIKKPFYPFAHPKLVSLLAVAIFFNHALENNDDHPSHNYQIVLITNRKRASFGSANELSAVNDESSSFVLIWIGDLKPSTIDQPFTPTPRQTLSVLSNNLLPNIFERTILDTVDQRITSLLSQRRENRYRLRFTDSCDREICLRHSSSKLCAYRILLSQRKVDKSQASARGHRSTSTISNNGDAMYASEHAGIDLLQIKKEQPKVSNSFPWIIATLQQPKEFCYLLAISDLLWFSSNPKVISTAHCFGIGPLPNVHFPVDGQLNVRALFVVLRMPLDFIECNKKKNNVNLCVDRVVIVVNYEERGMERIIDYQNLIKVVVEPEGLPLNIWPLNQIRKIIQKNLATEQLAVIGEMDECNGLYENCDKTRRKLIFGIDEVISNYHTRVELHHNKAAYEEEHRSLNDYVSQVKKKKQHICFAICEGVEQIGILDYVEWFKKSRFEIVYTKSIDKYTIQQDKRYQDKQLVSFTVKVKWSEAGMHEGVIKDLVILLFGTAPPSSGFSLDKTTVYASRIYGIIKKEFDIVEDAGFRPSRPLWRVSSLP